MTHPGDDRPDQAAADQAPAGSTGAPAGDPVDPAGPADWAPVESVESAAADGVDPDPAAGDDGASPASQEPRPGDAEHDVPGGADDESKAGAADQAESDELTLTRMELAERTSDLQRLQAEFLNYKRRVDRDRELIRENATFKVLSPIIEVLDTIDRAREHEDLDPGFRAVAEQLERAVQGLGLVRFGEVGDAFDPNLHEALTHLGEDPQVEVTTCQVIAKAGYRIGERVVRAAQVLVVDPAS